MNRTVDQLTYRAARLLDQIKEYEREIENLRTTISHIEDEIEQKKAAPQVERAEHSPQSVRAEPPPARPSLLPPPEDNDDGE
jgi:predicted RNase H-like nuclease (RuvC/YqgF family)